MRPSAQRYADGHGRERPRHQRGRQQGARIIGEEITLDDQRAAVQD